MLSARMVALIATNPFFMAACRVTAKSREPVPKETVVDVRESNPAATTVEAFTNFIERTNRTSLKEAGHAMRDIEDRQRWWQIGLGLMLVALAGEALLGRRAT